MPSLKRIYFNRFKGGSLPPNTKLITRSTRYGNPFPIGAKLKFNGVEVTITRPLSIALFVAYAEERLIAEPDWLDGIAGYNLACSCQINESCHGNVLLDLANRKAK